MAPEALRSRLAWLAIFALAFGYLESAVVVYLRVLAYPQGFHFPLVMLEPRLAATEVLREAATLVILLAVARLTAASGWGRFGAFAVAFGIWDLTFYAALRLLVGWPESLGTWDVLFLIPGVWTGPVGSATGIAALLVVCGGWMLVRAEQGFRPRLSWIHWLAAGLSFVFLLGAFLWNHSEVYAGGIPRSFPWALWLAGVLLGLAAFLSLFALTSRQVPGD